MSFLSRLVDERYMAHRQRATSIAGTIAVVLAMCLFAWRFFVDNVWSWDLLAIGLTAAAVKIAVMVWSGLRD
jgi:hypothetical protein